MEWILDARAIELRRYTLRPDGFQTLKRLFDDHFVAGQREAGIHVGPVYRDLDRPDRFVWWRGFAGMAERLRALTAFYDGPVWEAHRDEANSTMIDSDDVLLLRHTDPPHAVISADRPGATTATVIAHDVTSDEGARLSGELHGVLEEVLRVSVSTCRTEPATNTFPRLPVREASAFVWTADFSSPVDMADALSRLRGHPEWTRWTRQHSGEVELMRLQPTTGERQS